MKDVIIASLVVTPIVLFIWSAITLSEPWDTMMKQRAAMGKTKTI